MKKTKSYDNRESPILIKFQCIVPLCCNSVFFFEKAKAKAKLLSAFNKINIYSPTYCISYFYVTSLWYLLDFTYRN